MPGFFESVGRANIGQELGQLTDLAGQIRGERVRKEEATESARRFDISAEQQGRRLRVAEEAGERQQAEFEEGNTPVLIEDIGRGFESPSAFGLAQDAFRKAGLIQKNSAGQEFVTKKNLRFGSANLIANNPKMQQDLTTAALQDFTKQSQQLQQLVDQHTAKLLEGGKDPSEDKQLAVLTQQLQKAKAGVTRLTAEETKTAAAETLKQERKLEQIETTQRVKTAGAIKLAEFNAEAKVSKSTLVKDTFSGVSKLLLESQKAEFDTDTVKLKSNLVTLIATALAAAATDEDKDSLTRMMTLYATATPEEVVEVASSEDASFTDPDLLLSDGSGALELGAKVDLNKFIKE